MKHLNTFILILTTLLFLLMLTGCDKTTTFQYAYPFSDDLACVKIHNLYGFINKKGKVVIPPEYESSQFFLDQMAIVKKNGYFGIIDKKNNVVVPFIYDEAEYTNNNIISVKKDGKYGCINNKGETIVDLISSQKVLFSIFNETCKTAIITDDKGKQGFIVLDSDFNSEIIYDSVSTKSLQESIINLSLDGKYGFANLDSKIIIEPFSSQEILFETNSHLALVCLNNKFGFINSEGEIVIDLIYDNATTFDENGFSYTSIDGKAMVINIAGEIVNIEPSTPSLNPSINLSNNPYIPCIISYYLDESGSNKAMALSPDGKIMFKTTYDYIYPITSELFEISNIGFLGCINKRGIEILPPIYDKIEPIDDNKFIVTKDGKYGIIDNMRKEILSFKYAEIRKTESNLLILSLNNKFGYYNYVTKILKESIYDEVTMCSEFPLAVRQDNKWFYIDENGNPLF